MIDNKLMSLKERVEALGYGWEENGNLISLKLGHMVVFVGQEHKVKELLQHLEKRVGSV